MKKHITLLSGLCLVGSVFAQKNIATQEKLADLNTGEVAAVKNPATPAKALGALAFSSDFSTPGDWIIDNDGQTGPTFGWNINATKEGWGSNTVAPIINSTSDGNFAELLNGPNQSSPALGVDYYMTVANPIAITTNQLTLTFLQNGALFNDAQTMEISLDGNSWIVVGNNFDDHTPLGQGGGSAYPNPETKVISLTPFIPNGTTQIWYRFHWTSRFLTPPNSTNPLAWVTYGWHIDDVEIRELPDYDLEVNSLIWGTAGLNYHQIPNSQLAPIGFSTEVTNIGKDTLNGVTFGVNINAGAFTSANVPVQILPSESDSLALTASFTPTVNGTYNVSRSLTMTEIDDIPSNNAVSNVSFIVNDYIYARDTAGVTATAFTTHTAGFEIGNFFDIWNQQEVRGVDVNIATGSPADIEVYTTIYMIDQTGAIVYAGGSSNPVAVPTSSMNNSNYTILLDDPLTLNANTTYLVMVGSFDANLRVGTSGYSDDQTSFFLQANDWTTAAQNVKFYTNNTPIVRLNFDPTLSATEIADVATNVLASPNPFNNETKVSFNLKNAAEVSLVVTDLAGRTVYTTSSAMNAGEQAIAIDGSAFGAGMYNYTLTVDGKSITERIVKK